VENFFENAPKFKSSQQNNRISAAFLKQMLCATSMSSKYLFKSNLKNKITKQESRGRILNFSEILNFSTGSKEPSSQTFNTADRGSIVKQIKLASSCAYVCHLYRLIVM
jgi:hypothetical protein